MDRRITRNAVIVLLCGALGAPSAQAVNLVPNASFESYTSCPTSFGQLFQAAPWAAPTNGTSDHMNACAPATFPSVNVPNNEQGVQAALTGVGYAGIIPFSAAADYREYIEAPLTSPLVASASYLVRFYVSLADESLLAIDRLGAYLSVGPVGPVGNDAPLPLTPQVESPANVHLTDATNWTLVSGVVVAAGGEDHIVIGSFRDDASTSTVAGPGTWPGGAYYYIDDVSVELLQPTDEACCLSDGTCTMQLPGECAALGGASAGPGSSCSPDPCQPTRERTRTWGGLKTIYR